MSSLDRNQEEVKLAVGRVVSGLLDQVAVNNAATGRVRESAIVVFDEEGLDDSLVDNQEGDLGLLGSLVEAFVNRILELTNLLLDDLAAFSSRDTIAEDDDVVGQLAVVVRGEMVEGVLQADFQVSANNFLTLLLDQEV